MTRHEIRVIYGDTDQMGVVYYANYLRFFEAARGGFLRAHGVSYAALAAFASRASQPGTPSPEG